IEPASGAWSTTRGVPAVTLDDRVAEEADVLDLDLDLVAGLEREVGRGDDSGARHEEGAVGEQVVAAHVLHQVGEAAGHASGGSVSAEGELAGAADADRDGERTLQAALPDRGDRGAERGASKPDFRLREIERVVPLDAAGRDVVANGDADDLQPAVD